MDATSSDDGAAPPSGWRCRLRTPGAIVRIVLLALLSLPAACTVAYPLDRGQRTLGLFTVGVSLALFVVFGLGLWRHLFPAGALGRRGQLGFAILALAVSALCCAVPIPALYWGVVDTLANQRELGLVSRGLRPLVESLRAETRRAGRPPEDIAPLLARQDAATLRHLGLQDASSTGFVRYFSGADRFALAARGTPAHRDSFAVIVYTPWDDRWTWRDVPYKSRADHRAWLGAGGEGLQEWECLTDRFGAGGWRCDKYPREEPSP
jgi:hypothetical protein